MINFRHNLDITADDFITVDHDDEDFEAAAEAAEIAAKKAAKKARRQARDEMRAMFDFDGIRANAAATVTADEAIDIYDETEDPEAVYATYVVA